MISVETYFRYASSSRRHVTLTAALITNYEEIRIVIESGSKELRFTVDKDGLGELIRGLSLLRDDPRLKDTKVYHYGGTE